MEVTYICKKPYENKELIKLHRGSVIKVSLEEKRPIITKFYNSVNQIQECNVKIPIVELNEYFLLYDDIDTIDAKTAMYLFAFKYSDISNRREWRALKEIQHYTNARFKYLQQCATEDTRSERNLTETPHTTNQQ